MLSSRYVNFHQLNRHRDLLGLGYDVTAAMQLGRRAQRLHRIRRCNYGDPAHTSISLLAQVASAAPQASAWVLGQAEVSARASANGTELR